MFIKTLLTALHNFCQQIWHNLLETFLLFFVPSLVLLASPIIEIFYNYFFWQPVKLVILTMYENMTLESFDCIILVSLIVIGFYIFFLLGIFRKELNFLQYLLVFLFIISIIVLSYYRIRHINSITRLPNTKEYDHELYLRLIKNVSGELVDWALNFSLKLINNSEVIPSDDQLEKLRAIYYWICWVLELDELGKARQQYALHKKLLEICFKVWDK